MDNLGDWLYIVLLIAAGISGLLSSGKKKKRSAQMPTHPEAEPYTEEKPHETKSFWDVLDEVQKEQYRPQQQKPKPQPVKQKVEKVSTPKPKNRIIEQEEDAFAISSDSFHDTEELKKAIIYSEILNRKY